ncbi:hypothetical protein CTI12_AA349520 [Artemisia annua]|uniref:Uncharacterized protein n=1 Tax=Artemisia annua TaxID=35608 RepID=A0A2U1MQ57_ARTAN|nr:hypothetical protein CTI12_AA349520 [Artemisia annua]
MLYNINDATFDNVWIGKLRLHANVARFDRKVVSQARPKVSPQVVDSKHSAPVTNKATSYVNVAKNFNTGCGSNSEHKAGGISSPTITLSQDSPNDFPLALLGCYKDFRSIANTHIICRNEGFMEIDVKYLGGLWVLFDFSSKEAKDKFLTHQGINSWFSSLKPWYDKFVVDERLIWLEIEGVPIRSWCNDTFNQIGRKWGEVLFLDDSDPCNRLSKRFCVKSSHAFLIFESTLVTLNKVTYAIRVRELCSWTPNFIELDSESDDESNSYGSQEQHGDNAYEINEVESVAEFMDGTGIGDVNQHHDKEDIAQEPTLSRHLVHDDLGKLPSDSDPFGLDPLINKTTKKANSSSPSITPDHPPGFSPSHNVQHNSESIHNFSGGEPSKKPGFSLLVRLEETIKVGLALGLNMEGCEKTLASLIAEKGDFKVVQ